ncbi:hypothetical protein HERIO_1712 [Hepatospora eriocheir]|uniref:Uncharacterized protein n=1 Tax=Hepatospora eriocheir TaxID=1081669 RepID=A0A1X0Q9A8_9MICR|nr:hypothetical protein HERIO_1712 [Hepatospora eriocheir]
MNMLRYLINLILAEEIIDVTVKPLGNEHLFKNNNERAQIVKIISNKLKESFLKRNNLIEPSNILNIKKISKYIPTSYKIEKYIVKNLKEFRGSGYKIKNISIYDESGKYFDYFLDVEFIRVGENFIDNKSGVLIGKLFNSRDELIKMSKMSKTGFWIDKNTTEMEDEMNLNNAKALLAEQIKDVNNIKKITSDCDIPLVDTLIFEDSYPNKRDEVVTVCVCSNNDCSESCKEVRKVFRRDLYEYF